MKTTVHTINDRVVLGIRDAEIQELDYLLRVLPEWHTILSTDSVLSSCLSMMLDRLNVLEPVCGLDDDVDILDSVTVFLGKRVSAQEVDCDE